MRVVIILLYICESCIFDMDVRHQVFVSSTFRDLVDERREVMQALLELDCIPAGMELFPASNETALGLIKSVIDQSDYYIVIVGGKYGSTDSEGVSYTELEYDYAVAAGKPVLGFLHRNPDEIPAGFTELDPDARNRLANFRAKVEQRHCKYWASAAELGGVVSRSLIQERKRNPMPGWVRSDGLGERETLQRLVALQEENERLSAKLDGLINGQPPGTEQLEQGQDPVEISFLFRFDYISQEIVTYTVNMTWDEVIGAVGPIMLQDAGESDISKTLAKYGYEAAAKAGKARAEITTQSVFTLTPETRSAVIVQLVALTIIEKSIRKRAPSDKQPYWKLTAYGTRYLTQLRARRRP